MEFAAVGAAEEHAEGLAAAQVDYWAGSWAPRRARGDSALRRELLEPLQRRHR